jgi:hypothetical protein
MELKEFFELNEANKNIKSLNSKEEIPKGDKGNKTE